MSEIDEIIANTATVNETVITVIDVEGVAAEARVDTKSRQLPTQSSRSRRHKTEHENSFNEVPSNITKKAQNPHQSGK